MSASLSGRRIARNVAIALLMAGGVAAAVVAVQRHPFAAQPASPAGPVAGPPAVPVTAATVRRQDIPILLRNIGAVQAFQSVLIRARVDGTLDKVLFTEGQDVHKGDLIAQLDPRPYQAALDQALAKKASDEAQLANARRDLTRSTRLAARDFASQQEVDTRAAAVLQLDAQMKADDAAIQAARVNVDYTNITAPFDGRVGLRQIDAGNVVRAADAAGVGIVTITQIRPIAVLFTLPQDALPRIQAAMAEGTLTVFATSADDRTLLGTGTLLTTDNAIDPTTGTIKLKAVFPNADLRLWPGQFVNVKLQIDVQRAALTVPSVAVQRGPDDLFVYLVKPDRTVSIQPVGIGQDDGNTAVVLKGLTDGATVVVNGMSRLQDGSRVTVADAKPAS
jgi:multidrug efflux system membrane fusion protein